MCDNKVQCIRLLDDHLRENPTGDIAILTPGIAALGQVAIDRIIKDVTAFAEVCYVHEPDEDQHTGRFADEGRVISFKIDHYERPARSAGQTGEVDRVRIFTVMLAEES